MATLLGGWFIPITVTAGGTIAGWINGKLTDGVDFYKSEHDPTPRDHTVRIWAGMVEDKKDSAYVNAQGFMPHVVLYDERGDMIGRSCGKRKYIKEGNFQDIKIVPKNKNNVRAAYVRLFQWADDALCISAIQVTYPDSGSAMVYGDVPHALCGWKGYTSITDVTAASGAGPPRRPFCFWMDANDSYNPEDAPGEPWLATKHKAVSATFHLRDFHGENQTVTAYSNNTDLICKSSGRMQAHPWKPKTIAIFKPPLKYDSPGMLEDNSPSEANYLDPKFVVDSEVTSRGRSWSQSKEIPDNCMYDHYKGRPKMGDERCGYEDPPGGWIGKPSTKRSLSDHMDDWDVFHDLTQLDAREAPETRPLQQRFANDIVATHETDIDTGLFAEVMCANPSAVGPSLVNTFEGKYCDMITRQVWPVCGSDVLDNCFLMQDMTVRGTGPQQPTGAFNNSSVAIAVALAAPIQKKFTRVRRTF